MIGDRFYKPVQDWEAYTNCAKDCPKYNAMIVDKGEYYECIEIPAPTEIEKIQKEVNELKKYLSDTDWAVVKCFDLGLVFKDEYPQLHEQRKQARTRINELEN